MNKFYLPPLPQAWADLLKEEINKPYFGKLQTFLASEAETKTIFPPQEKIFAALEYTPYEQVKVVILGQDPYHNVNQAEGLAFSVSNNCKLPPSLKNIFKELQADVDFTIPKQGSLIPWAKQGVLLLNTVLTVEAHKANSHSKKGWEQFTDAIISLLNQKEEPIVFLLWGNNARSKKASITKPHHLILEAPHPSPLSAYQGFFGCQHFSAANKFLKEHNQKEIQWQLSDELLLDLK